MDEKTKALLAGIIENDCLLTGEAVAEALANDRLTSRELGAALLALRRDAEPGPINDIVAGAVRRYAETPGGADLVAALRRGAEAPVSLPDDE